MIEFPGKIGLNQFLNFAMIYHHAKKQNKLKNGYLKTLQMTGRQTDRQTDKQTRRQTGRQTDRPTDRQTGRKTDKWEDRGHFYIGGLMIMFNLIIP